MPHDFGGAGIIRDDPRASLNKESVMLENVPMNRFDVS